MKLTCVIIDDEPNAVNLLEILIQQTTTWEIVSRCYNGLEALSCLKEHHIDLVFLDINMPLLNGMELATLLPEHTKIVFTTAYAEHAAESYRFQTIDYLLKPITLNRFLFSVQKIELAFNQPKAAAQQHKENTGDYFFVKSGKTLQNIALKEILYFEGEKEYVRLVTVQDELLVYRRLKDIDLQMGLPFVRVHNSYIINIECISKILDNHVYIREKRIPISDKFRDNFMNIITKRAF